MNIHFNTPEGTRDRLYAECLERRQVQGALVDLFRRRGYAEVITPEVEFYDLFVHSGSPLPQETMLKIIDRSGKIMVMRPDTTTPIARLAATKLKTLPLPQRLYYDQTVFRSGNAHEGGSSEIAQCGVEMLGATGMKADLEMITLAVDALRACGLSGFHIEVGHVGFYQDLASRMNMPQEEQERMRLLIELFGGAEVLEEARTLAGACPSLDYLELLYRELCQAGYGDWVQFDLGLVHQIDYYTGVVFRGYANGAGAPVLSGGRYDNLVELFGRRAEATGFAVDVDAVGGCLEVEVPQLRTVIHYESGMLGRALEVMDRLPAGTCELSPCRTLSSTMNLAREKGALQVLCLDNSGERWLEV